jgi:hypothetical protein
MPFTIKERLRYPVFLKIKKETFKVVPKEFFPEKDSYLSLRKSRVSVILK